MKVRTHVCAALLALVRLVLLVSPALAEDGDPTILEVQLNGQQTSEAPLGAVLMFKGKNFHLCPRDAAGERLLPGCRHEEVRVTVGGVQAGVLAATPETVTFLVPRRGIALGLLEARLEIAGRPPVSAPLKLLSSEEWTRQRGTEFRGCVFPEFPWEAARPAGQDPSDPAVIESSAARDSRWGWQIEVEAASDLLPDKSRFRIQIREPDGDVWDDRLVNLDGGRLMASFGPYPRPLPLGDWEVRVVFVLADQSADLAAAVRAKLPTFVRLQRQLMVRVGSESELRNRREGLSGSAR